ncbi:LPXTG cell wall anchor domain-containing protein [Sporosarcina sp. GW1-11]|uniref:LPXTG cell wall anchor domain-containing protein n=1 Tax=Sporosarcina sp. GW1-11 TaxID=2899126 RepID=UPI00294FEB75|nr:LPXTG cell wall anchor domain-containing protein [Sporosarcina sp. GW1-11]MDV6377141.1 LPXTG cell wall anchor domain-containing protein [Sporosarcina sp. GW1-11]
MKKRVRVIPFLLMVLVVMNFKPIPTAACSCMMPPSADIALSVATAVFSGEVVKVEKNNKDNGKTIHFNVREIWKGIDSATVSVFTGNDSASCGIDFTVGKEYLVYAHTMDSSGKSILSTTLCDRTAELANAADDLTLIGEGQIPDQTEQTTDSTNQYYVYAGILAVVVGSIGLFLWKRSKKS